MYLCVYLCTYVSISQEKMPLSHWLQTAKKITVL